MTAGHDRQPEEMKMARGVRGFSSAALRNARLTEGLSPAQLAQEVGVSPMTISRWESGQSLPTAHNLSAIAQVLGRHPADFVHAAAGIRLRRNLAGLTLRKASAASGLAHTTISHLEHGHTVRAAEATIAALAQAYGCTPEDIRKDIGDTKDALRLEIAARQAARRGRR